MQKVLLTIFSVFLLGACGASVPSQTSTEVEKPTETVKLGVLVPLSGDAAAYGSDIQKVLSYEIVKVNENAAKNGYQFELIYEDGKCSGSESVTGFQKMIDIDGVDFVIGGFCSSETLAVAPIAQSNEVVLFSGWSSNPDIEKEGDFVFTLSYSDSLIGKKIADELNKYSKVAMITEQNDYNVGIQKVVLENLADSVILVADETFAKGGTDFRNILEKIPKEGPEVLLVNPNAGVTAQNLLKQLAEIPALAETKLIGQVAYLADFSREDVGDTAEGMVIVDAPTLTSPKLQAAYDAIEAQNGQIEAVGLYYTASTLDVLNVLTDVIQQQAADPVKVKEALRRGHFDGYLGAIYFGDNNFVQDITVSRYIVTGGKAVPQQ